MKIGIDIRETIGKKTGKGYYTFHLISELLNIDKENDYLLYSDKPTDIFDKFGNATLRTISKKGYFWHRAALKDIYKENINIFLAPTSYIIPAIHNPKKIKVIMTVHDLVAFLFTSKHNKKAVFIEKSFLKRALKKAMSILAVSKNTKKDIIDYFKVDDKKISVIYNAGSSAFKQIPEPKFNNLDKPFILGVGTLEPRKNFATLIKAFSRIHNNFPEYKLVIAGGKGWYFDHIFKIVKELKLEEKVKFLGYVSENELVNLYNLAKIFVYPSLYEGFGIPPLEAMKCGCPVITSNTSSLPEVVGDAAIKINPDNDKEIAEAMNKLLKDKSKRNELQQKGFKQAEKFSWRKSAQNLLDEFIKLDAE